MRGLTAFSRGMLFGKRETGLSDRDVGDSKLEERMYDLRAVLAATGSEWAAVVGFSEGGALFMLFAATHPERVQELVLHATFARAFEAPGDPEGDIGAKALDRLRHAVATAWGRRTTLEPMGPSLKGDAAARRFMGPYERLCVSPRAGSAQPGWLADIDVRSVARTLQVPTLVVHLAGDRLIPVAAGRVLAREIPMAPYVEVPDDEHPPWAGDAAALIAEIQQSPTGSRSAVDVERALATVLFTDIVGSTERAVQRGDSAWLTSSVATTPSLATSSSAIEAVRSTPPATVFSRRSTAPPARSAAPRASATQCETSGSRPASAPTRESASASMTRLPASPSIPARA